MACMEGGMLHGTVDGEVHGGAVLADGKKGHSLYLDRIDGWVDLGNHDTHVWVTCITV